MRDFINIFGENHMILKNSSDSLYEEKQRFRSYVQGSGCKTVKGKYNKFLQKNDISKDTGRAINLTNSKIYKLFNKSKKYKSIKCDEYEYNNKRWLFINNYYEKFFKNLTQKQRNIIKKNMGAVWDFHTNKPMSNYVFINYFLPKLWMMRHPRSRVASLTATVLNDDFILGETILI